MCRRKSTKSAILHPSEGTGTFSLYFMMTENSQEHYWGKIFSKIAESMLNQFLGMEIHNPTIRLFMSFYSDGHLFAAKAPGFSDTVLII